MRSEVVRPNRPSSSGSDSSARTLLAHVFQYGAVVFLSRFLRLLLLPVYTRILTPGDYGVLEVATTTSAFAAVLCTLGIQKGMGIVYFDERTAEHGRKVAGTGLLSIAGLSVLSTGLFLVAGSLLGDRADWFLPPRLVLWLCLTLPCTSLFSFLASLLRVTLRPRAFSAIGLMNVLLTIGGSILAVIVFRMGVEGILLFAFLTEGISFVVAFAVSRREITWTCDRILAAKMIRLGTNLMVYGFILQALETGVRYTASARIGVRELGLFAVAAKISLIAATAMQGIEMAWGPWSFSIRHLSSAQRKLGRTIWFMMVIWAFAVGTLALFGREILWVLAGPGFQAARGVILPLLLGQAVHHLFHFTGSSAMLASRLGPRVRAAGVSATVALASAWFLGNHFGLAGFPWSIPVGYVAGFLVFRNLSGGLLQYPLPSLRIFGLLGLAAILGLAAGPIDEGLPLGEALALKAGLYVAFSSLIWILGGREIAGISREVLRRPSRSTERPE